MKHFAQEDGWDNHDLEDTQPNDQMPAQLRYHLRDAPRDILESHHHSLEPDMVMGWRPKLPSCPLPLSYNNAYYDALTTHIPTDDRFKVAYFGPRYTNSVQVNQQYNYFWRYRSRYNTSINVVKEAIKRVGDDGNRNTLDITRNQILFDSAFESGNLDMAVRVKRNEYDLFLRCDTNTRGHIAWFYFKVDNLDQVGQIQFNICNFGKKKNLYAQGMKPYVFQNDQWKQGDCYDVVWAQRICRYGFDRKTFQLQFKYNFREKNKPVYFAYSIPYTYSQLQNFIAEVSNSSRFVKTGKLCETLGGIDVPLLTITNTTQNDENSDQNTSIIQGIKKKCALITGRIHPGQSHSSYIIEGLISFLVSDDPAAIALREKFIFYLVPMLNPDGVVAGNFRTSFSGKDLNRQFNKLNKYVFPEVTYLHQLALQLKHSYRARFHYYFDFHSHASKRGLFCYGPEHTPGSSDFFRSRALAKLIEQKTPIFHYNRSIFTVSQAKKATGRAHMLWKIKVPMTYTFEVSNGLYETKQTRNTPLRETILRLAGATILEGFCRFVQLESKMPSLKIKAKIDTGIHQRGGYSAKQFRKSSSKKARTLTVKTIEGEKSTDKIKSSRRPKNIKDVSLKEIIESEDGNNVFCKESKKAYLELIDQIKKQESTLKQMDQYEGGSDSESDEDDLDEKELRKLHKIIEARNETSKTYSKGSLQWRCQKKNTMIQRRQSQSEENKFTYSSQEIEGSKKPVTSKYLLPIKNSALPPRAKKLAYFYPEKEVLAPKNFDLAI